MSISMDDVARRAGVAKSTVSLVLNNRPGVSAEMRRRVLDAAEALGYSLPGPRDEASETPPEVPAIALVHCVDDPPDIDPGLTHLYLSYRNGIQRFTHGRDISVMLVTSYRDHNGDSLSYQMLAQQEQVLDGLILMGTGLRSTSRLVQRALERQTPTVILGRHWPDLPLSSVSQDHSEQAHLILDHLISLGHRHIGLVAREVDRTYDWFTWRVKTFRETLSDKLGLEPAPYVAIGADVAGAVQGLLERQPQVTALLGLNDHIAYQAMQAAISTGRTIPNSLSVAGIDGAVKAQEGLPLLTTVAFPHERVGYLAAELLLKQMQDSDLRSGHLTVRSRLVTGASCAEPKAIG